MKNVRGQDDRLFSGEFTDELPDLENLVGV